MRALVDPESLARELSSDVLRSVMREDAATQPEPQRRRMRKQKQRLKRKRRRKQSSSGGAWERARGRRAGRVIGGGSPDLREWRDGASILRARARLGRRRRRLRCATARRGGAVKARAERQFCGGRRREQHSAASGLVARRGRRARERAADAAPLRSAASARRAAAASSRRTGAAASASTGEGVRVGADSGRQSREQSHRVVYARDAPPTDTGDEEAAAERRRDAHTSVACGPPAASAAD